MRVLELSLSAEKLPLFGFLKSSPTKFGRMAITINLSILSQ